MNYSCGSLNLWGPKLLLFFAMMEVEFFDPLTPKDSKIQTYSGFVINFFTLQLMVIFNNSRSGIFLFYQLQRQVGLDLW